MSLSTRGSRSFSSARTCVVSSLARSLIVSGSESPLTSPRQGAYQSMHPKVLRCRLHDEIPRIRGIYERGKEELLFLTEMAQESTQVEVDEIVCSPASLREAEYRCSLLQTPCHLEGPKTRPEMGTFHRRHRATLTEERADLGRSGSPAPRERPCAERGSGAAGWQSAVAAAGLDGIKFHELRHSSVPVARRRSRCPRGTAPRRSLVGGPFDEHVIDGFRIVMSGGGGPGLCSH